MTAEIPSSDEKEPPHAGRFEELLAAENEQFDPAGELLASIVEYTNAPSGTVSPPTTGSPTASYDGRAEFHNGWRAGELAATARAEHDHDEFVNQILEQTPDSWDDDAAAEHIAVEYVRALERRVLALGGSLERWPEEGPE